MTLTSSVQCNTYDEQAGNINLGAATKLFILGATARVRAGATVTPQTGGLTFQGVAAQTFEDDTAAGSNYGALTINNALGVQILNPQTQEQDEYADIYADYRDIQGIQTPMHIARFVNEERVAETFRNSAQYDRGYPRDYFQPGGGNPEPQTP